MVRFVFFYFNFFPTTVISFRIFLLLQRLLHLLSVPILLSMAMQIRLNTFTFFPLKFCHSRFYYHFVVICFFSFLFKLNLLIFWRHFILSNYKRISFNFLFFLSISFLLKTQSAFEHLSPFNSPRCVSFPSFFFLTSCQTSDLRLSEHLLLSWAVHLIRWPVRKFRFC